MSTLRVARRRRYTQIDRRSINDERLSFRARGLLIWLLDKPDDWSVDSTTISAQGAEGRDAIRTAMRELEGTGYLVRSKRQGERGRWLTEVLVYEHPDLRPADATEDGFSGAGTDAGIPGAGEVPRPTPGKPTVGQPVVGKPGAITKTETETQDRSDADVDQGPSPSRTEPEAEDGISVDHRGGQLIAEIAGVLGHPYLVEQLYRPDDAGGRRILGRELTAREAAGWPTVDLVVEVASGITVDTPVTSIVGVLLTRARRLDERPFVASDHSDSPGNHPDPLRSVDAYRTGQLDAARRHGEVLAGAGLPPDLLFAELEHRYANQPGDPLGERFQAALQGAGLLDERGQPTDLLRLLGGAA